MAHDDDDPFAGIPDPMDDLARAEQHATIRTESRRYGKPVTIVEGLDPHDVDLKALASELKKTLGTGGTVDDGAIELQGDHPDRVADLLRDRGFHVD